MAVSFGCGLCFHRGLFCILHSMETISSTTTPTPQLPSGEEFAKSFVSEGFNLCTLHLRALRTGYYHSVSVVDDELRISMPLYKDAIYYRNDKNCPYWLNG